MAEPVRCDLDIFIVAGVLRPDVSKLKSLVLAFGRDLIHQALPGTIESVLCDLLAHAVAQDPPTDLRSYLECFFDDPAKRRRPLDQDRDVCCSSCLTRPDQNPVLGQFQLGAALDAEMFQLFLGQVHAPGLVQYD